MSPQAPRRSRAWRVRDGDDVVEYFGPLHRRDSMLEWGSITKTVTATIAQRLDEDEMLDLDGPVVSYLPASELPEQIDLRSLIEHTSGLRRMPSRSVVGPESSTDPFAILTTEFFDERVVPALPRQRVAPSGQYQYSDLGYALLTRILETVTGRTYWDLAQDLVLSPLGLGAPDIGVDVADPRVPVIEKWAGWPRRPWSMAVGPFVGSGGLISTIGALESYALEAVRNAPDRENMIGWQRTDDYWWHHGQTRDHGAWVGVNTEADWVIAVHMVGYVIFTADVAATRLRRKREDGELVDQPGDASVV